MIVDVVDALTGAPVPLARVLVQGEVGLIGYTDADGHARFESVATGAYRAMVVKKGFVIARSPLFDVGANRTSSVRVRLQRAGVLKQIGSVSVSTSPARASREVGQDDALRYLDGSLRDALGDLPGVTSAGDGVQIDGNDPSQTGTTLDGVPVAGAGGSLAGRGINADLFGGASVSSGAAHGALGGDVGFRTLQPTRFAQQQATLQYGSDNSSSALVLARGSIRNLGYVVEHATRGRTSPFTGLDFTDQTGLSYRHDGDRLLSGDLGKLRWAPSIAQTLTVTATGTNVSDALACAQLVARFPCGYGPGAFDRSNGRLLTVSENATIGATTLMLGAFANGTHDETDESNRMLAGVAAPQRSELRANARGFNVGLQLPGGDRHDLSLNAQSYGLALDAATTTTLGSFSFAQRTSYHGASVSDRYHPNQRVTLTARAGVNGGNGSNAFATGLDVRWQPNRDSAYDVAGSLGDAGAGVVVGSAAFPDPRSLTFDCANGVAYGSVPSSNAARQRSSSLRASAERSGRRGRLALTAWTARLIGAPVLTAFDASAAALPPGYLGAVGAFASSPYVCGSPAIGSVAFTSYQPADQLSRGATLAGTLEIGKALIAGFASVQSRFVTGATPFTTALTPAGAQVPGTPLHRAGLVATAKLGRSVDVLANASYTAANNANRLRAYTVFNAGFAAPLREGSLAIVGTNLGNAHPGPFVSSAESLAFSRAGAAPLALPASPLAPRAVALTYTVRTGRLGTSGSGAGTADASTPEEEPHGGVEIRIRARPLREGPHPDALRIDPDNDACTPAAAGVAQPVMDAMGRIAAAAERAKSNGRYPASIAGGTANAGGVALAYTPYDDGARFVVAATSNELAGAAVVNCARLSVVQPGDAEKFHVYVPASQARGQFFVAYSPVYGIYLAPPPQAARGGTMVRISVDPEPAAPPAEPFALRAAPACAAGSKPVADAVVAAVRAAREAQRAGSTPPPAEIATIVARGTAARGWLEIAPADPLAQAAIVQCLHVAGVPRAHLQAAGIDDARRPGEIGFSDRFGFYLIARPPE
ncbi:MAG TPA: TonB-dependent receptor [Candidatus Elarobacter sp.]|nr:TonB-dependent receptor [Candidatus Elarobacter sp.]